SFARSRAHKEKSDPAGPARYWEDMDRKATRVRLSWTEGRKQGSRGSISPKLILRGLRSRVATRRRWKAVAGGWRIYGDNQGCIERPIVKIRGRDRGDQQRQSSANFRGNADPSRGGQTYARCRDRTLLSRCRRQAQPRSCSREPFCHWDNEHRGSLTRIGRP